MSDDVRESSAAFKAARVLLLASLTGTSIFAGYSFAATALGTGQQLRDQTAPTAETRESKDSEGKCGEGACGGSKSADDKGSEGKCGEGSCGGGKPAPESKDSEGKCGEGTCGN